MVRAKAAATMTTLLSLESESPCWSCDVLKGGSVVSTSTSDWPGGSTDPDCTKLGDEE